MSLLVEPVWPRLTDMAALVFDFDGVFTDNKVYVDANGSEHVRCDRADGLAIDMLRRHRDARQPGLDLFILSTERHGVVSARAQKLQLACRQAVSNKRVFLEAYLQEKHAQLAQPWAGVIYVGNDLNDLECMQLAGFSIAPVDAHPLVQHHASVVMPQAGGCGFVRALVEQLLGVDTMSVGEVYELVSDR